jgi:heat shock protein HslJ
MVEICLFLLSVLCLGSCSTVNNVEKHSPGGSWMMTRMTGVELNAAVLTKGLPVFRFDLSVNRFSGHAGCNQLGSDISVSDDRIKFGLIISKQMACPHMEVENAVMNVLSEKTLSYEFKDSELTLRSGNGTEMHFVKQKDE